MFQPTWSASLWFTENAPDFYLIIVSLISLIVIGSSLKLSFLMHYRSSKLNFKVKVWDKRIIFYTSLLLIGILIGLIIYRLEAYYGIIPFYTTYTWKLNLFSSFVLIIMLGLWGYKGYVNKMFLDWQKDFVTWKQKHFAKNKKQKEDLALASKSQIKKATIVKLTAPVSGTIKTIDQVSDQVFSQKTLGDGLAIEPKTKIIYAPIDGKIESAFPTGHAFGIKDLNNNLAILLHIGVDTVQLKGQGFKKLVTQGQEVKQGDPLVEVDFAVIKKHKLSPDVIMVVLPESNYDFKILMKKEVKAKQIIGEAKSRVS